MAYCQACGNDNRSGAHFCRTCGQPLEEPSAGESTVTIDEQAAVSLPEIPFAEEALVFNALAEQQASSELTLGQSDSEFQVDTSAETGEANLDRESEPPEAQVDITSSETAGLLSVENPSPPADDLDLAEQEIDQVGDFDGTEPESIFGDQLIGVVLGGRYRVLELVSASPESQVYAVEDLLRCWSCDAEQISPDEQFCEVCGAAQTQKPRLWLRQYPADQAPEPAEKCFRIAESCYCLEALPEADTALAPISPLIRLAVGYRTDPGREREINEDSLLVLHLAAVCETKSSPTLGFFAIADGIGGNEAGELASRTAVHCLASAIMEAVIRPAVNTLEYSIADWEPSVKDAVGTANREIIQVRSQAQRETNMGCTLTAALVGETQALVVNVGDSRTYRKRQGHLEQVTRDHSIVARLVEQGFISKEEIYTHDQKSVIYRSLGDRPDVEVDAFQLDLLPGDRLLLCSDGLWEMVRDPLIEEVLLERYDPQQACDRLVELANLSGGEDNISVVVVNIEAFS